MRIRAPLLLCTVLLLVSAAPDAEAQQRRPSPPPAFAFPAFAPAVLAGGADAASLLGAAAAVDPRVLPLVELARDPADGSLDGSVAERLTDEQEALLGCGVWWGTDCSRDGIDLRNADASVLVQTWAGARSAFPSGRLVTVPGARGPFLVDGVTPNPHYDVSVDGTIGGIVLPPAFGGPGFTFASEMAALSFNLQLLLVAFGTSSGGRDEFDPSNPHAYYDPNDRSTRWARGQCSFLQPQYCSSVQAFLDIVAPPPVRAGGNGSFGRRDFVWHGGSTKVARRCLAPPSRGLAALSTRGLLDKIGYRPGRCPRR